MTERFTLSLHEVPSGTQAFDWTVPPEWTIRDAFILDPDGQKIASFQDNNLHLVGYSEPVDLYLDLDELQEHLYSIPDQPDAIPYVTSYYKRTWGFCLRHRDRQLLRPGRYHVQIDSDLQPGSLTYGEMVLPGDESSEVLLSTYVCHPSLANNELSGPVVLAFIGKYLQNLPKRRLTYRLLFLPETIGSLVYLSRHLSHLKKHTVAGYVLTCIGDERAVSFLPSRSGETLSDRCARHVLKHFAPDYKEYSFLDRGSDERQYCSPGADLPMASLMHSKYGTYPEYHTSLDDLSLVTDHGLRKGFDLVRLCLETLESNLFYQTTTIGEPQMGRRGLYTTTSQRGSVGKDLRLMMNILAYSDGKTDLIRMAEKLEKPVWDIVPAANRLLAAELLETKSPVERSLE